MNVDFKPVVNDSLDSLGFIKSPQTKTGSFEVIFIPGSEETLNTDRRAQPGLLRQYPGL